MAKLTRSLFWDTSTPDMREKNPPKFTLKLMDYDAPDGNHYPSAYRIYMESVDEYEAAIAICGNLADWENLISLPWFLNGGSDPCSSHIGLKAWREHMAARDRSLAKKQLMEAAEEGNVSAQRKLYDLSGGTKTRKSKKQELKEVDNNAISLLKRMENK